MNSCVRCSVSTTSTAAKGTLFLAPPLAHTFGHIRKLFKDLGIAFEQPAPSVVAVALTPGRLEQVVGVLAQSLSAAEQRDTRSLVVDPGITPSLNEILATLPLSTLIAKTQELWLVEMIRDKRLTSHFQPIVRAQDIGEVHAYECLLRGQNADGSLMAPTRMYDAARDAELLFQLDRAARLTAIREAVRHRIAERLFINFNPSSIYDPAYCLKSTVSAIEQAGIAPDRIVFEVVESDHVEVDLLGIMSTYRRAGFRVALDDLGAGYGSLNLLSRLRPDVVKLDMKLVRDVHLDTYKASITAQILQMARKLGVEVVAEGVESADELQWFRDHRVDYVQGYFIAPPSSPPIRPSSQLPRGDDPTREWPAQILPPDQPTTCLADSPSTRLS